MPYVWLNGTLLEENEATIPVTDRGFLYGEGSFTTVRVTDGQAELWPRHVERLDRQARWLGFVPREVPDKAIDDLIAANAARKGIWRLKVVQTAQIDLMTIQSYSLPTEPLVVKVTDEVYSSPSARYKTLAYLDRLHYLRDGMTLLRSPEGFLLEASIANIFWILEGVMHTPSRELPLLWGITIDELSRQNSVVEGFYRLDDIPQDAELYLCNCLMGRVRCVLQA